MRKTQCFLFTFYTVVVVVVQKGHSSGKLKRLNKIQNNQAYDYFEKD